MVDEPTIKLEIFRYHPESDSQPTFCHYDVPYHDDWVVLDALNWIKDHTDGALAYRWSCRMGVCGSCGMMVNGEPKLTCATFLRDYYPQMIRIEPLVNFPVERDLMINFDGFMEKLRKVKPYLIHDAVNDTADGEFKQTPRQLAKYQQYSMCINCMLCYSACPVVGMEPDFLGPAALALAQRYNKDSRDQGSRQRLDIMLQQEALWDCTFVGECTKVCPKNVDPAGAIQQAKVEAAQHWYLRFIMPKGAGP